MATVAKSFHKEDDPVMNYIQEHSSKFHPVQVKLIKRTLQLPGRSSRMLGAPEVVQLTQLLMRSIKAKKAIDVGVFTGMSALSAALALPEDGKVLACDVDEYFTSVAKEFWKEAGVDHKIELHLRPATETLQTAIDNGEECTYDFAFIDADKVNYSNYYELCLKLLRPGGIIAVDNVLWSGSVADPSNQDEATVAIRALNDKVAHDDRVFVSMQNIGDGLTICLKK